MPNSTIQACDSRHALQCLEVWGGNQAIHDTACVPGIDVWISSDPCCGDQSGGDICFVSVCGCQQVSRFVVADVSGHGSDAGTLAEYLRQLMRKHIGTADQSRFAWALNREFSSLARKGRFATALLATYDPANDNLVVCNAGHPAPLWYHASTRTWEIVRREVAPSAAVAMNVPFGIVKPTSYVQFTISLGKDDLMLMYSDSLIEARNTSGAMLEEEGLLNLVRPLNARQPAEIGHEVLAAIDSFRGGFPANDDQTLMVLHHTAADPPSLTLGQKFRSVAARIRSIGIHPGESR